MRGQPTPPPPPGSERRRYPRYQVFAQVEISGKEATLILPVNNISAGGISVALDKGDSSSGAAEEAAEFSPDEAVTVFLDAGVGSDGRALHVTMEARIVRINRGANPGVALCWTNNDAEATARFEQVLEFLRKRGVPDEA